MSFAVAHEDVMALLAARPVETVIATPTERFELTRSTLPLTTVPRQEA